MQNKKATSWHNWHGLLTFQLTKINKQGPSGWEEIWKSNKRPRTCVKYPRVFTNCYVNLLLSLLLGSAVLQPTIHPNVHYNNEIPILLRWSALWCYRRILKIKWTDWVPNTKVLSRMKLETPVLLKKVMRRQWKVFSHVARGSAGRELRECIR